MVTTILVPIDLSPHSRRALDYAREFGSALGKPHLILVHAYHLPPEIEVHALQYGTQQVIEALSARAAEELQASVTELQDAGISCEYLARSGKPEVVIPEVAAERACDYIALTTHGRTGLAHAALGSIAERIIRHAPCPVISLRVP